MNAIVVVALKRPYTFVVLAIPILLFGAMAVSKTPTDIFPSIRIPVVAVVWNYNGLLPSDMSGRVVYYYERALTTTVGNIEHIESQSLYGSGVVKIFFQPGTDVSAAQAQGMLPMSFSNTQNAPLGRAVIGGLLVATVTTLLFVPCVFAMLHGGKGSMQKPEPEGEAA
jgi:multidrug efflux pump subunit AcrB